MVRCRVSRRCPHGKGKAGIQTAARRVEPFVGCRGRFPVTRGVVRKSFRLPIPPNHESRRYANWSGERPCWFCERFCRDPERGAPRKRIRIGTRCGRHESTYSVPFKSGCPAARRAKRAQALPRTLRGAHHLLHRGGHRLVRPPSSWQTTSMLAVGPMTESCIVVRVSPARTGRTIVFCHRFRAGAIEASTCWRFSAGERQVKMRRLLLGW
jgi:hypothetical protein